MTVRATAKIMNEASFESETEKSWEMFRDGIPGNLKTMEGLLFVDKENEDLLSNLSKGYAVYGLAVPDTLYVKDYLQDSENTFNRDQAIYAYSKGLHYGLELLANRDIDFDDILRASQTKNGIEELFDKEFDVEKIGDASLIFFMGQAWIGLVNLQRDNPTLISQLPVIKSVMDWVCLYKPDFYFGVCNVFYGAFEASRPVMLGGNPQKAKNYFVKALEKFPENLFNRVSYIQYYLIPAQEEDEFKIQKDYLIQAFKEFKDSRNWGKSNSRFANKRINLLNAIAMKRFELILEAEKNLF